jgi:outer membrane protein
MRTHQARLSKITLIVALIGFALQVQAQVQNRVEFTVSQAVEYAKKNSVQVRNALIDIAIRSQGNREITASAYPQIKGSVNVTKNTQLPTSVVPADAFDPSAPPGTLAAFSFGLDWNATWGVSLDQILFDGQVFVGLQARRASIDYVTSTKDVTEEAIKANVMKVYYQLVVGQKQVSTIDANIVRTEKLLHDTKALFENGFQEKLDVDKVTVNLANLRTEKTKIENTIRTGYIGLKYLMGMPVKTELVLTDTLSDATVKENLLYDSVRYEDRKEFQLLQSLERLNRYDIKRYQFQYVPTVSLVAYYAQNAQRQRFDVFKGGQPWYPISYFGLNINIPIFDGFAKDARIKSARLTLQKTQNNIADLQNKIDMEVDSSLISMRNAIATLDAQQQNMDLANEVYNQTKIKYDNGLGSNLEITNAEAELRTAQNNYFSALYSAIVARIDYLRAVGKL